MADGQRAEGQRPVAIPAWGNAPSCGSHQSQRVEGQSLEGQRPDVIPAWGNAPGCGSHQSQRVEGQRLEGQRPDVIPAWGNAPGCAGLVPDVPFVEFDPVFCEEGAVLVLKRSRAVMLLLPIDIRAQGVEVGWSDGECAVTALP